MVYSRVNSRGTEGTVAEAGAAPAMIVDAASDEEVGEGPALVTLDLRAIPANRVVRVGLRGPAEISDQASWNTGRVQPDSPAG